MTFRTPDEAVELANNTRYRPCRLGLVGEHQPWPGSGARVKAGVVWINGTNMFDAAAGFGGYRESGFGREGGREGLYEYLVPARQAAKAGERGQTVVTLRPPPLRRCSHRPRHRPHRQALHRRQAGAAGLRLLLRGRQPGRQDGAGQAGLGNRKDIRNAVEAAAKAASWGAATAHNRAQILYYIAENLSARAAEFEARLRAMTGASAKDAAEEVATSIRRTFFYAGFADKHDGAVHSTKSRACDAGDERAVRRHRHSRPDEHRCLVSCRWCAGACDRQPRRRGAVGPPCADGTDFTRSSTPDLPAGAVSIVTGATRSSPDTGEHDDVDGLWVVARRAMPPHRGGVRRQPQAGVERGRSRLDLGATARAGTSCAGQRRSRTSGCRTGSREPDHSSARVVAAEAAPLHGSEKQFGEGEVARAAPRRTHFPTGRANERGPGIGERQCRRTRRASLVSRCFRVGIFLSRKSIDDFPIFFFFEHRKPKIR